MDRLHRTDDLDQKIELGIIRVITTMLGNALHSDANQVQFSTN